MDIIKEKADLAAKFITTFIKWVLISVLIGAVGGTAGLFFYSCLNKVTSVRVENEFILWFLPLGGLLIIALYKLFKIESKGTDCVLQSIYTDGKVPAALAPVIFVSTVITHLLGGSAGREGAALQMGGSIGSEIGKLLRLDTNDMQLAVMCGMSAVFSAVFGTPLTAAFFAIEVSSVGLMYYTGLIPCIVASYVAYGISTAFGAQPVKFILSIIPDVSLLNMVKAGVLAVLCAGLSIVFCLTMRETGKILKRLFKNAYIRAAVGGAVIVALTLICGTYDYNGAGMDVIKRAISGKAVAFAFILKIIFTAVTIGSGYKGGEIVPTFFAGATFGCIAGEILGLDAGFSAAVGMIATFCGVVNCPVASILLGIEVFGGQGTGFFALACVISYMLSGYCSLYSAQRFAFSKLKTKALSFNANG